jgi:hypothetical protein
VSRRALTRLPSAALLHIHPASTARLPPTARAGAEEKY